MHGLLSVSSLKPGMAGLCICLQDAMSLAPYCIIAMPLASLDVCTVMLVAVKSCSVLSLADIRVLVGSDNGSMLGLQACQHPLSAGHQLHQYPSGLSLWSCCGGSLQTPPA